MPDRPEDELDELFDAFVDTLLAGGTVDVEAAVAGREELRPRIEELHSTALAVLGERAPRERRHHASAQAASR